MSSFDHSRGEFAAPSSFTRQDNWNASDGWTHQSAAASPPLPTSSSLSSTNGFQQFAQTAAHDLNSNGRRTRELDYSVIDEGEGGAGNERGFVQQDVDTRDWNMPEQLKVSIHLNPNLEGSLLQKHHVWIVNSNNDVRSLPPSSSSPLIELILISKEHIEIINRTTLLGFRLASRLLTKTLSISTLAFPPSQIDSVSRSLHRTRRRLLGSTKEGIGEVFERVGQSSSH